MNIIKAKHEHLLGILEINTIFSSEYEYDHSEEFMQEQLDAGRVWVAIFESQVV